MSKLYTEEQVRKAINDASLYSYINGDFEFKNSEDDIINALTPIELPSNEEIEKYATFMFPYAEEIGGETYTAYRGMKTGAKWMKEQILNQNK